MSLSLTSLTSLVSATELAVQMSEKALAEAEKALVVAKEANTQAYTALTAAKLALVRENRRNTEETEDSPVSDGETGSETESGESETIEQFMSINIDEEGEERGDENQSQKVISSHLNKPAEPKKKKNMCDNCKRFRTVCLDGKFLLKVVAKTRGMKVIGWDGPSYLVGRVGTVLGGSNGSVQISWDLNEREKIHYFNLEYEGKFAFKFFCQNSKPKDSEKPPVPEDSGERSEEKNYIISDRELFVGGFDKWLTDKQLKQYFEQFGSVTDWIVMRNKRSLGSQGYGFVTFQEPQMMENCLNSQPHLLNGRTLCLRKRRKATENPRADPREEKEEKEKKEEKEEKEDDKKLFVSGLDPRVRKDDLKEYFEKFGELTDWVVMLAQYGISKCVGFVTFKSALGAEKCYKARPHDLNGKFITVKRFIKSNVPIENTKPTFRVKTRVVKAPEDSGSTTVQNTIKYSSILKLPAPTSEEKKTDPSNWLVAHRLPVKEDGARVWSHNPDGEKQRLRFCASENITLKGIGLLVKNLVRRVTLNICQERGINNEHRVIFKQDFENVPGGSLSTKVLKLHHGVELRCDLIYLLVLTMYGGASYAASGGEEFVSVNCGDATSDVREVLFKFEDYKHRTDKYHQATDVEQGLLEKIYFQL